MNSTGQSNLSARARLPRGRRCWARAECWLVPLAVLLSITLPHLSQGDWRGDAGWYSAIALQAWRTGELWTLHAEPGQFYFNKPPLAFWIHGLFLHALGPGIGAARLPTVLASCGCVIATIGIARQWLPRWPGLLAGVILALTYEFFRRNREISLDLWQLMFMLGAVWLVAIAVRRDRIGPALLAGIPLGLALLCKPLVALAALPMLAIWLLWAGPARRAWWLLLTGLVAIAVAAPWHISMAMIHGPAFTSQYFGAEIAARAAGEAVGGQLEPKPVWFYFELLISTYWPWLAVVAGACWAVLRSQRRPSPPLFTLGVVWTLAWLALFTVFADRRPRYALPLYPGLAWIAAVGLASGAFAGLRPALRAWMKWAAPAALAAGVIFAALPVRVQRGPDPQWPAFFEWVKLHAPDGVRDGAFAGAPAARMYLETGRWPGATRDRRERMIGEPSEGDLLAYHRRGGRSPGPNETVEFEAGDLKVTRLGPGGWKPELTGDPGER
ncbi:MAG: glycosyltransferase family 39 protein [Phycisphaerales bacterium]|nr:glycosyltransferase family 39 protein [Phycisphaerales bacterium]